MSMHLRTLCRLQLCVDSSISCIDSLWTVLADLPTPRVFRNLSTILLSRGLRRPVFYAEPKQFEQTQELVGTFVPKLRTWLEAIVKAGRSEGVRCWRDSES
ncbi:unnamed protein product [Symbiodinium natans]|uniref:Uncharacterized protein n=1 Tax=Symbiodinium natans TaxID=878477 RepID=A0A812LTN8_9DINO|nr:unnamed protein product [Symbiodinium natans]